MKPNNSQLIILGVVGVLLLWAYQKGIFSPERGKILSVAPGTTTQNSAQIDNLISSFRTTIIDSYPLANFFSSSQLEGLLNQANNLSTPDLTALHNRYAQRYPNDTYKTLYSLINSVNLGYGNVWYARQKLADKLVSIGAA
jgi:hypothetical protein